MKFTARAINRDKTLRHESDDADALMKWIEKTCDLTFYKVHHNPIIKKTNIDLIDDGIGTNIIIIYSDFYSFREFTALLDNKMQNYIEKRKQLSVKS